MIASARPATKPIEALDFAEITSKLQRLNLEYEDLFKQEQRTKEESEKLRIDLKKPLNMWRQGMLFKSFCLKDLIPKPKQKDLIFIES